MPEQVRADLTPLIPEIAIQWRGEKVVTLKKRLVLRLAAFR
jgi:hypothetical protein